MTDIKAEALAITLGVTLPEGRAERVDQSNSYTVEEAMANRLRDTSAMPRLRHWSIRYLPLYQRCTLRQLVTHWAMWKAVFLSKRECQGRGGRHQTNLRCLTREKMLRPQNFKTHMAVYRPQNYQTC